MFSNSNEKSKTGSTSAPYDFTTKSLVSLFMSYMMLKNGVIFPTAFKFDPVIQNAVIIYTLSSYIYLPLMLRPFTLEIGFLHSYFVSCVS